MPKEYSQRGRTKSLDDLADLDARRRATDELVIFAKINMVAEIYKKLAAEKGLDPNIPTVDGWTPLLVAAQEGNYNVIDALIKVCRAHALIT